MRSCTAALLVAAVGLASHSAEGFSIPAPGAGRRTAVQMSSASSSNNDANSFNNLEADAAAATSNRNPNWRAFRAHMIKREVVEGMAIDTHRSWKPNSWAHDIGQVEKGCLLLAHETLQGVFSQTVVLILDHDDTTGTLGLILNRPTKRRVAGVPGLGRDMQRAFGECAVHYGGPVGAGGITALHSVAEAKGSEEIAPQVYVGGFDSLIRLAKESEVDASSLRLAHGHAAWGPGQLARELKADLWYIASACPQLITASKSGSKPTPPLWNKILELMGGPYAEVSRRNTK